MTQNKFSFILLLFGLVIWAIMLVSCSSTYQYDVYVKNQTAHEIKLSFKTLTDKRGKVEETINLGPGVMKKIISTINIPADGSLINGSADHCSSVAEYIRAEGSTLEWCDPQIQFQTVDIQQGEFTVIYKPEHF